MEIVCKDPRANGSQLKKGKLQWEADMTKWHTWCVGEYTLSVWLREAIKYYPMELTVISTTETPPKHKQPKRIKVQNAQ